MWNRHYHHRIQPSTMCFGMFITSIYDFYFIGWSFICSILEKTHSFGQFVAFDLQIFETWTEWAIFESPKMRFGLFELRFFGVSDLLCWTSGKTTTDIGVLFKFVFWELGFCLVVCCWMFEAKVFFWSWVFGNLLSSFESINSLRARLLFGSFVTWTDSNFFCWSPKEL